ncbi:sigma-70 family RNA polymerase sigma factor [Methylobacterium brachythecii]|uniref:RNA polymerase factor sigma-70 n=2 Tax=Methylobacterium brachythecii TaxID=1176177 RepID=A0A7W6AJK8_9HYPH|nr:sigma-70 family RNA polymerase sigma factor [Methylobacterium brachythecii]MBB3904585.1 RNA polymerase sigma-70 factor (ECF subfamily) [Methylobacterium brachythecii]GLS46351.1 RNA polymerase factor sigma-70 [Methylobacterium brachythecii]
MGDPMPAMPVSPARQDLLDLLLADRARFVEVAYRILKCRAKAEDVVQDAALRIWQNGPGPELHSPAGYLRRMIRNLAIDAVRQVGLECRLLAPIGDVEEAASPCPCPHERMEACQALKAVLAALDQAPARTRNAILAHRLDGVPQKTIAAENGVSPTLVNFMIRDATALCRKALEDEGSVAREAVAA